ncbi:hypothetical protein RJ641_025298 [Dillenia turbinata]|uniref:Uncharacterized protein n=1 Tax=Dillenia turbinata TaxID=194707 RepID=A0AAN8W942_9MAGN
MMNDSLSLIPPFWGLRFRFQNSVLPSKPRIQFIFRGSLGSTLGEALSNHRFTRCKRCFTQKCKRNVGLWKISCTIQKEQKGWWNRLLKSMRNLLHISRLIGISGDLASGTGGMYAGEVDENSDDEGMIFEDQNVDYISPYSMPFKIQPTLGSARAVMEVPLLHEGNVYLLEILYVPHSSVPGEPSQAGLSEIEAQPSQMPCFDAVTFSNKPKWRRDIHFAARFNNTLLKPRPRGLTNPGKGRRRSLFLCKAPRLTSWALPVHFPSMPDLKHPSVSQSTDCLYWQNY